MATPQKIAEMVFMLQAAGGLINGPTTPKAVEACAEVWMLVLHGVSDDELQQAVVKYLETGRFWPSPADIRLLCPSVQAVTLNLETADPVKGRDRWPEIVRQAGSIGRACPNWPEVLASRIGVKDSERLKRAIDDAGGWRNLCLADHDAQRASMGRRFAASWDRQARAAAAGLLPSPPQRVLEASGSDDPEEKVVDILAELERRKRLGAARG